MMWLRDIPRTLKAIWPMRSEIVPCLLSKPGIGKTEMVYQFSQWIRENTEYKNSKVVEIITSQIIPSEVSGLTMPDSKSKSMEIYDHYRLSSLQDGDILFFDELLQGSPQVLSACLTLIQERRLMSGHKLPDIMIVAAANPTASPEMIPAAIRQRFMFVEIACNNNDWARHMKDHYNIIVDPMRYDKLCVGKYGWNELTPRTATKLLLAYQASTDRLAMNVFITNMFNEYVANWIADSIRITEEQKTERSESEIVSDIYTQIADIVEEQGVYVGTEPTIPEELMDIISMMENPEEIRNLLDTIEIQRYN